MVSTKALHKEVISANSSEEIASTDGNGPFATNAAGCADGDYGMYVNMQALRQAGRAAPLNSDCTGATHPGAGPALAGPGLQGGPGARAQLGVPRAISLATV